MVKLFIRHDACVYNSNFIAKLIGSIFIPQQDHLYGVGGQIERGQEGGHHVGGQLVHMHDENVY